VSSFSTLLLANDAEDGYALDGWQIDGFEKPVTATVNPYIVESSLGLSCVYE
jgi:hypothetical protein